MAPHHEKEMWCGAWPPLPGLGQGTATGDSIAGGPALTGASAGPDRFRWGHRAAAGASLAHGRYAEAPIDQRQFRKRPRPPIGEGARSLTTPPGGSFPGSGGWLQTGGICFNGIDRGGQNLDRARHARFPLKGGPAVWGNRRRGRIARHRSCFSGRRPAAAYQPGRARLSHIALPERPRTLEIVKCGA